MAIDPRLSTTRIIKGAQGKHGNYVAAPGAPLAGASAYAPQVPLSPLPGQPTQAPTAAPTSPQGAPGGAPVSGGTGSPISVGAPPGGTLSGLPAGSPFPGSTPTLTSQSSPALGQLQNLYQSATQGTLNSYNDAANRLRERTDATTKASQISARDSNLSRGFGASTKNDRDQQSIANAGQESYGQGLSTLSDDFEKERQAGLSTALGATNSSINNSQFGDNLLANLQNNREQRVGNQNIANTNAQTQENLQSNENAFQGNQANQAQQFQGWLQQFLQQNENFRTSLGLAGSQPTPSLSGTMSGA